MSNSPVVLTSGGSGAIGFSYEPASTGGQGVLTPHLAAWACVGLMALSTPAQTTGGSRIASSVHESPTSDASWVVKRNRNPSVKRTSLSVTPPVEDASEQVQAVRRVFSMTMQHMADVVGVTRPVVYRWREGSAVPRMRHRSRLDALSRLADHFVSSGGHSVGFALHRPFRGSTTLFDLLRRDPLPEKDIKELLSAVAASEVRRASSIRIGEALQRRGIQPLAANASDSDREDNRLARLEETSESE